MIAPKRATAIRPPSPTSVLWLFRCDTWFSFADDEGSFGRAAGTVGVGSDRSGRRKPFIVVTLAVSGVFGSAAFNYATVSGRTTTLTVVTDEYMLVGSDLIVTRTLHVERGGVPADTPQNRWQARYIRQ